jgi:hypothetical protein
MQNIVPILKQTPFNYGFLVSSASTEVCVARAVDVSWARTVGLSVRVHRADIAGGNFQFFLYGTNPSPSDGTDFLTASLGNTTSITTGASAGTLVTLSTALVLTDVVHPFLRVVMKATGTSGGSAVALYAELSATLILRAP